MKRTMACGALVVAMAGVAWGEEKREAGADGAALAVLESKSPAEAVRGWDCPGMVGRIFGEAAKAWGTEERKAVEEAFLPVALAMVESPGTKAGFGKGEYRIGKMQEVGDSMMVVPFIAPDDSRPLGVLVLRRAEGAWRVIDFVSDGKLVSKRLGEAFAAAGGKKSAAAFLDGVKARLDGEVAAARKEAEKAAQKEAERGAAVEMVKSYCALLQARRLDEAVDTYWDFDAAMRVGFGAAYTNSSEEERKKARDVLSGALKVVAEQYSWLPYEDVKAEWKRMDARIQGDGEAVGGYALEIEVQREYNKPKEKVSGPVTLKLRRIDGKWKVVDAGLWGQLVVQALATDRQKIKGADRLTLAAYIGEVMRHFSVLPEKKGTGKGKK